MSNKFRVEDIEKVEKAFYGMSPKSRNREFNNFNQLVYNHEVTIRTSDILGLEFMIWLEKKGAVKRI